MATYVLVHGATGGAWQMREVAARLIAAGHMVFTPTLTGLGERAHLLTPAINLQTHVDDIVNLLSCEDLHDLVLLGKSYAGVVITLVAERAANRIRHLVYLDAIVPENGRSIVESFDPEHAARLEAVVLERGDGWRLPADTRAEPRLTDHPFATFTQRVELTNPAAAALPRTYIRCTATTLTLHARETARAAIHAQATGWRYRELATGHDPQLEAPQAVTDLLLELA